MRRDRKEGPLATTLNALCGHNAPLPAPGSAYLHQGCQHGQAVRGALGYIVAAVFRIVVNDVNLWGRER